jgi:hypothetical protein
MKASDDTVYQEFRSHLRYLNDKIGAAFSLFIKLATAIVGGAVFLSSRLLKDDPQRDSLGLALGVILATCAVSQTIVLLNHLWAWYGHRKTLSELFPDIPFSRSIRTYLAELVLCAMMIASVSGFDSQVSALGGAEGW